MNEDGDGAVPTGLAPATSEWSTILLPTKVWLILEVWVLPYERPCIYPTQLTKLLLMTWRCNEPGHQQWWYWSSPRIFWPQHHKFNTLRQRRNGQHFANNIFKPIFYIENVWIAIRISLKFVPKGPIPALVQIMAWHHPGDKPLSEPRMVSLPTEICITRPQWVNAVEYHCNMIPYIKTQYCNGH